MLSFDNSSCFPNSTNKTLWQYGLNNCQSSLIIFNNSLQSNEIYHFRVNLINIENSSLIYSGDLLVQIEDNISMTIIIK